MFEKFGAYIELTKPKVTLLNLFVAITCFVLGTFPSFNLPKLVLFALAGYFACGGCGALNCVFDRDTDRKMERTSKRAIPNGLVSSGQAASFGLLLTSGGILISYFFFNFLTAIMMVLGAVSYLVVYTVLLKRTSHWNVVIGGLAGCFAALSGWSAASKMISLLPLAVSLVDFLWTPGHLWGLAMKKVKEYRAAGIPMLPASVGLKKAARIAFLFNVGAVMSSLVFPVIGLSGLLYFGLALFAGAWFLSETRKLLSEPSGTQGFRVFLMSMPYLAVLMVSLIADRIFLIRI